MITSDAIRCLIPSDSAIKGAELFCSASNPVSSADSQTWAAWGSVLANFGLLAVAVIAGILAFKQLRQMKNDSFDRSRPYVAVQVIPSIGGRASYDLLVHNLGSSRAHSMTMKLIEPIQLEHSDEFSEAIGKVFSRERSLVPGERIRLYWRLGLEEGHTWADEEGEAATRALGMPERTLVQVDYRDERGNSFSEQFWLDTTIYVTAPGSDGGTDPDLLGFLTPSEKSMQKRIKEVTSAIRELGR